MNLLIAILFLILLFITIEIKKRQQYGETKFCAFDVQNTLAIRGVLALSIALHHFSQEIDSLQLPIVSEFVPLGAVIVGVFFFLTGYGLMVSYMKKGESYLSNFLSHRFLKLLPAFLIATFGYLVFLSLFYHYNAFALFLDMKNGKTPLPSSWFIFTIILYYIAFYIMASLFPKKTHMIIAMWVISILYEITIRMLGWGNYWFISIYALNIGQCYAYYEDIIKTKLEHSPNFLLGSIWGLFALFIIVWLVNQFVEIKTFYKIYYCFTAIFIVFAIYVWGAIPSKILRLTGTISYEFYLVQGIFVNQLNFMRDHWVIYLIMVYFSSYITAWLLHYLCLQILRKGI